MTSNVADTENTFINLRIYLVASRDAHLLLASDNQRDGSRHIYEIGVYLSSHQFSHSSLEYYSNGVLHV